MPCFFKSDHRVKNTKNLPRNFNFKLNAQDTKLSTVDLQSNGMTRLPHFSTTVSSAFINLAYVMRGLKALQVPPAYL